MNKQEQLELFSTINTNTNELKQDITMLWSLFNIFMVLLVVTFATITLLFKIKKED